MKSLSKETLKRHKDLCLLIPTQTTNKFKNAVGKLYTRGLFYEESPEDKSSVVYTLKDTDHLGFPSLYRLYMETADPTEYQFAVQFLDTWAHWVLLSESTWFRPYVDAWRKELEIKLRSKALSNLLTVANDKMHTASFQANKYLLESHWKATDEKKRGRPTRDAIRQEAHRIASEAQREAHDLERIGVPN